MLIVYIKDDKIIKTINKDYIDNEPEPKEYDRKEEVDFELGTPLKLKNGEIIENIVEDYSYYPDDFKEEYGLN